MLLTECNLITFVPSDLGEGIEGGGAGSVPTITTFMALVAGVDHIGILGGEKKTAGRLFCLIE